MTAPFRLRRFAPADQDAARCLILEGMKGHWGEVDESLNPDLLDIAGSFRDGAFWVAAQDGRVIGTGGWRWRAPRTVEITRMSVAATCRRSGVGRALLQRLMRDACDRGATRVCLETNAGWSGEIAFYEASPFGPILWFERSCEEITRAPDNGGTTCQTLQKMS